MRDDHLDVSVVLPVYNEAGHLREDLDQIVAGLAASELAWELVIVDDASTDGSGPLLDEVAAEYRSQGHLVTLIHNPVNRGSGGSRRIGTRAAQGELVVWTDVDLTYPNDQIPWLVKEQRRLGVDQLVGARTSEQGTKKVLRVPAKWFVRRLAQYLVETPIPDLNSGFRVFRRDIASNYLHLLPRGFSCVTTMTMSFLANDHTVGYVDIEYKARAGESKFHPWHDTKRYLLQVVRMVLSYNPLRFFAPFGLLLLLGGVGKLGFDLVTKDLRVTTNTLLLLFAAFQVIAIGLLADLVVRVTSKDDGG